MPMNREVCNCSGVTSAQLISRGLWDEYTALAESTDCGVNPNWPGFFTTNLTRLSMSAGTKRTPAAVRLAQRMAP